MFVGADELWLEMRQDSLPLHVLEYEWDGYRPSLICLDRRNDCILELGAPWLDMTVSKSKNCVGYFDGDRHIKCPSGSPVTKFSQCDSCSGESFLPFQGCVFEPRCEGEECDIEFCKREHVLYLALYNTRSKIGMSSTRRVERRLIEQGADAFSIIGSYPNRRKARSAEKDVSSRLRISQGIRQKTVLQGFTDPVDHDAMERVYRSIASSIKNCFGLSAEPLTFLDGYPISLPLQSPPELMVTSGRHRGNPLGIKGKWLIYEDRGIRAMSLQDLVGRYLAIGPDP
ncbi:MAG: DUF2797 domain-containing protein [Thermoplasmata archaeon]|nr:DUF2797 domain-containing protein [Thermoplasmata archaeon]